VRHDLERGLSMAYNLSAVDIFYLTKELKVLEGAKFDKIQQIDRYLFVFKLFKNKEKLDLRAKIPDILNITEQKYESPQKPLAFCTFLRKHLSNTRIKEVRQHGFERILVFEIDSAKEGELCLIMEFFKPGNLILCKKVEEKLIVLNALESQEFSTRKTQARHEYSFPPKLTNPLEMNAADMKIAISTSGKILGKFLAIDLGFGGVYADEVVLLSGLDKNALSVSDRQAELLVETIKGMLAEKITCTGSGATIFPVAMKSIVPKKEFTSFNEGLDTITFESAIIAKAEKATEGKKTKVERLMEMQKKRLRELAGESDEAQKIGEFIYEHYQEFSKLLEAVKEMRRKGKSYDEIEQTLKENKKFSKMNKAKKTIEMEF
jgi:predicted ribosome quality control (RQC) complex YloA/Tae2 family protein